MILVLYLVLWPVSFAAAWLAGGRAGRRADALWLAGILGVLGLAVFGLTELPGRGRAR